MSNQVLVARPPSPWRSSGKFFDYTYWDDRERFAQLDELIAANPLYVEKKGGPKTKHGQRNADILAEREAGASRSDLVVKYGLSKSAIDAAIAAGKRARELYNRDR